MGKKGKKLSMKTATIFSAIVSLVSFLYKMGLGIMSTSIILIVASLSTLIVFVCKVVFVKNITATREKKKKAYFIMMVLALSFGVLFLLFSVLRVGGIDTSSKNKFEGFLGYLFLAFIILMFVLSIINLKGALEKSDIMVLGLKEMTFISALTDAVIIEEFLYKVVLKVDFIKIPFIGIINRYFPLIVAVAMLAVPFFMFKRFKGYEVDNK